MATFRVGQRVRVVRDLTGEYGWTIGLEGTIIEGYSEVEVWSPSLGNHTESAYTVLLDEFPLRPLAVDPDEIEPIQPEGYKKVSWEDCCFTPEGKYIHESIKEEVTQ